MKNQIISFFFFLITLNCLGQTNYLGYPFSNAKSVVIASFVNTSKANNKIIECREIPKLKGKIDVKKLSDKKELNATEIKKLAAIILSSATAENNYLGKGFCSEKGYAILFLNEKNQVFEYLEFCYNCKTSKSSFKQSKVFNEDYNKFEDLKKFFNDNGFQITKHGEE